MKPDGLVPIPLVLDLWALGHSQGQIAEMVGLPNRKHVERIIKRSRSLGDPRAVLHFASNGRLIGRPGRTGKKVRKGARTIGGKEAVLAIGRVICQRGHALTPDNRRGNQGCRACSIEYLRAYRAARKSV